MCGFLHFLPRRHKLHIIRPAPSGRSYSFHCASSPQKVVKLFGAPDKGKYLCTSALAKCKILLAFSQSPQRVELHFFLNEHLFLHAERKAKPSFLSAYLFLFLFTKNPPAASANRAAPAAGKTEIPVFGDFVPVSLFCCAEELSVVVS